MKKKLVIFGTGDYAEVADFYLREFSDYEVVAFTVDEQHMGKRSTFLKRPLIPFEKVAKAYPTSGYHMLIAVAYSHHNMTRKTKYEQAKEMGYTMASFIHPHNCIASDLKIGEHCFIFENQTIQPFVEIGDNTVLWSGNHIGHHSKIGSHVFIASHVVISGKCKVGDRSFIGVNATLRDNVKVSVDCFVGAFTYVNADISAGAILGCSRVYLRDQLIGYKARGSKE